MQLNCMQLPLKLFRSIFIAMKSVYEILSEKADYRVECLIQAHLILVFYDNICLCFIENSAKC